MRKIYVLLMMWLALCLFASHTDAQTVYPYFPESNVKNNLGDVATTVIDPSSLVVDQSKDFTLEVNGTVGVLIKISNGISAYEYTPASTSTVRFVKKASVVYVYENGVYKTTISPVLLLEFPAIRAEADDKTNLKGIYSPLNRLANPGFETRVSQGSTTHFRDGVYWNAYNEAKALDWGTGSNAAIRSLSPYFSEGSWSLVMHTSSRYLTQNLGKLKPNTYYQINYDYWSSSPASSNGGATYNILLGTTQFGGDVTTLTGPNTSLTESSKKTFAGIFKTPETLPDVTVWLTLHRPISKVDWIDRVSLLETITENAALGVAGTSGPVLYVEGVAYAPEIHLDMDAGDYVEMTLLIVNPSFESSFNGWTNNGMALQTNTSFGAFKNGNTYVEKWLSAPPLPDVSITQKITGLPNGSYTLKLAAHHTHSNLGKTGAKAFANSTHVDVTDRNEYSVNFLVLDGTASIGFKTENSQGNWAAVDNFRLAFKGFDVAIMKNSLQELKDSATVLLGEKMQNAVRAELVNAIDAAQLAINDPAIKDELAAIHLQLQQAVTIANLSIAAYGTLQTAVDSARGVYGDGSGNRADVLLAAIEKNQTLVDNLDATPEALKNGASEIYEAIFAYRLANASGPAPVVTTQANFARGATMAFGRSSLSIPVSELLEHGFCWSTSPEPTINDNRTTKYLSKNGFIYRVEPLQPATVYYMRAYAIANNYMVGYGDVIKVITLPKGTVTYQLTSSVTGSGEHYPRIAAAVESAVNYFNNLTSIQNHRLTVHYGAGTPTAEASYGGWMRFGPNASYQRTGTALHEMGHTIGVGQHSMWYGPNSPLRATGTSGAWLGERANSVVQFLENNPAEFMRGDGVHMWPYGINGAHEDNGTELLYIGNALIHQALGEDGLPPTGGFATPSYTFNQNDGAKYYIKTQDASAGRNSTFLVEDESGQLINKELRPADALQADSAAWYFKFNPATGYYQIQNAATGRYFTYQAAGVNGIRLTDVSAPGAANSFQLMGARYTTKIGEIGEGITVKPYWIVRPEARLTPPCFAANVNGTTSAVTFNNRNEATTQHWLFLSSEEVSALCTAPAFAKAPEDIIISTSAAGCDAVVNYEVEVSSGPGLVITYSFEGATTGAGDGTGSGIIFNQGKTKVVIAATNSCGTIRHSFYVTVNDSINPVIVTPPAKAFCYAGTTYTVPALIANDNCGIASISYSITGATSRTGSGADAGGEFNVGVSTITWTVTDVHQNQTIATTTVTVNPPLTVQIPDVYAVNQNTDHKNTLYNGYGPATLTLTAEPTGGTGTPYRYEWSTAQSSPFISVGTAGEYSVTVTDEAGCTATSAITINMVDVTCGNNSDKVMVCHNGKIICITSADVREHLNHGDHLGNCETKLANARTAVSEESISKVPGTWVYPNPSNGQFTILLNNTKAGKASVLVVAMNGGVVLEKQLMITGSTQSIGLDIGVHGQGIYLVKLVGADGTKTQKIIVQR